MLLSCQSKSGITSTKNDTFLIIPGKSAEGYILGEAFKKGDKNSSLTEEPPSFLSDILQIQGLPQIVFDHIHYSKSKAAVFTRHNIINAVIGLKPADRITDDAVRLSDGADNYILNYGNSGIEIIRDGKHRVYIYRKLGIAVFDDNGDDSIDMYLLFIPSSEQ